MDPEILAALLSGNYGGMDSFYNNPALAEAAMRAASEGVSRTTFGQATDPTLLLSAGIISPSDIVSGVQSYYDAEQRANILKAEEDYIEALNVAEIARAAAVNSAETAYAREAAPPRFVSDVETRYSDQPLVLGILSQIKDGTISAGQAQQLLSSARTIDEWMPLVGNDIQQASALEGQSIKDYLKANGLQESDVERLNSDFSRFSGEAATYRNNLLEYEQFTLPAAQAKRDAAIASAETKFEGARQQGPLVSQIDPEQARMDFYKEMGLEGLSFLPDPTEQYRFGADAMLDLLQRRSGPDYSTLAERQLANVMREQPAATRGQSGPSVDVEADLRAKYGTGTTQVPTGAFVDVNAPRRTAEPLTLANVLASQRPQASAERAVLAEREEAMKRDEALGRALARRGRTPFEDALRRYMDFSIVEAG